MSCWKPEFDKHFDFVLEELRKIRKFNADGSVYLLGSRDPAFGIQPWLKSALKLDASNAFKSTLVSKIIFSPDLPENFDGKMFRSVFNREKSRLEKQTDQYQVVIPICGLPSYLQLPDSIIIRNTTVSFKSKLEGAKWLVDIGSLRAEQRKKYKLFFDEECERILQNCTYFIVECDSISALEAQEVAYYSAQIYLGVVNYTLNAPKYSQWTSVGKTGPKPLNDVLVGPQITAHSLDGSFASDAFWYDPPIEPRSSPRKNSKDQSTLSNNLLYHLSVIADSRWRDFLEGVLIRYNQAFSEAQHESALLAGWKVLEYSAGDRNTPFEKLVDRAANCTDYREEMVVSGLHLKYLRNSFAHGHISEVDEGEAIICELQRFLRPLLNMIFFMQHDEVAIKEDLWALLDLPDNREARDARAAEIKKKLELYEVAKKFFNDEQQP